MTRRKPESQNLACFRKRKPVKHCPMCSSRITANNPSTDDGMCHWCHGNGDYSD